MIGGQDHWEILERIGAHCAEELSVIKARKAERLVLENAEVPRLAQSCTRMLALLRTTGEESPEVPEAIISHAIRRAGEEAECESCEAVPAKDAP